MLTQEALTISCSRFSMLLLFCQESFGFDAPPFTYADFEQSDVIVLIGSNLCIAHPILWQRVLRNRNQPQILVIDPRKTETAMAATVSRAQALAREGKAEAPQAAALAENFCVQEREKVEQLFHGLWHNHDELAYRTGRAILSGEHAWLEQGGIGLGVTVEELRPKLPPAARDEPAGGPRRDVATQSTTHSMSA